MLEQTVFQRLHVVVTLCHVPFCGEPYNVIQTKSVPIPLYWDKGS